MCVSDGAGMGLTASRALHHPLVAKVARIPRAARRRASAAKHSKVRRPAGAFLSFPNGRAVTEAQPDTATFL